ncbi:hypothetical protein C8J57DRAFT_1239523 [Mycena rebaudengoi]|nr:hypothetical protein C8J57DRAFT_1239523 [Mycena rebaudengoi]
MNRYATAAIRIIEGLLTAERPMPSTQKVQVRLDEKKAEQNQAVSAKKAHIKEFDPNANITSPKGRKSVKNSSRMRRLKLAPGYYWPMAHYSGVAHFPVGVTSMKASAIFHAKSFLRAWDLV